MDKLTVKNMVFKAIRKNIFSFLPLVFTIIASIVLSLIPPLVLERCVNAIIIGNGFGIKYGIFYFLALLLSGIFDSLREISVTACGQKITREIRLEMCDKLSRLPAAYFTKTPSGVISSYLLNDVEALDSLFKSGIIGIFVDIMKIVGIVVMIFTKSLGLGIVMALAVPIIYFVTSSFKKKLLKAQSTNRKAVAQMNNHIPETVENIRTVHNLNKEEYFKTVYRSYVDSGYKALEKSNFFEALYTPVVSQARVIVLSAIMVLAALGGGYREFFGITVGSAVAITDYINNVFTPIENLGMEIQNIQKAVAGIKRINAFMLESERKTTDESITLESLLSYNGACVEAENLDFSYDKKEPILKGLNLSIGRGESVTLRGRTGAGKTTFFRLILGLLSPDGGNIKVFGAPADAIPDSIKRRLFGYIEQNLKLVPGTIIDQITLGDETISFQEAASAAEAVGLQETINSFEKGYLEPMNENIFSAGQLQLLAVARAIAGNPQILLLDEITANLDSDSEEHVINAVAAAVEGRTVISISHRLNSALNKNRIVYLRRDGIE